MISVVLALFGPHSVSVTCKQDDMEGGTQMKKHSHICFFLSVQPCNAEHDGAYSCQKSAICSVNCQCNIRLASIMTNQQKVGACANLINNKGSDRVITTSDTSVSCNFAW